MTEHDKLVEKIARAMKDRVSPGYFDRADAPSKREAMSDARAALSVIREALNEPETLRAMTEGHKAASGVGTMIGMAGAIVASPLNPKGKT